MFDKILDTIVAMILGIICITIGVLLLIIALLALKVFLEAIIFFIQLGAIYKAIAYGVLLYLSYIIGKDLIK